MNKILLYFLTVLIVFSSCSLSKDVNNGRLIQKRKYTKGFHIGSKSKIGVGIRKKAEIEKLVLTSAAPLVAEEVKMLITQNVIVQTPVAVINEEKKASRTKIDKVVVAPVQDLQPKKVSSSKVSIIRNKTELMQPTSMPLAADIAIYTLLFLMPLLPLMGGTIYLAIRQCKLSAVLINLLLIILGVVSAFVAVLIAWGGTEALVILFILLALAFMISAFFQGIHALKTNSHIEREEHPEFYIID